MTSPQNLSLSGRGRILSPPWEVRAIRFSIPATGSQHDDHAPDKWLESESCEPLGQFGADRLGVGFLDEVDCVAQIDDVEV